LLGRVELKGQRAGRGHVPTAFASAPSNRREGADSKADAEGKGDTSTGKADNGSNKASGGKDSSGATSGHKAAHKNNK